MSVPMIYVTGFFMLFTVGGITGVMLANPTISFQVHNTPVSCCTFSQRNYSGRPFWPFGGRKLLVSESIWLSTQ